MTLLWMLCEKIFGLHGTYIAQHAIYSNFIAIPAITIYVLALLDKKKSIYQGRMTYLQGFGSGVIMTIFITLLSPLSQVLMSFLISPEYFPNMIAYSLKTSYLKPEDAKSYFSLKNYIIQGMIGAFGMGMVTSAIIAIFTKSSQTNTF